ncbi:MAG: Ig-like domain-containing protein, partial [Candidatus Thermoplasmatota archaeon]|nr:Ig-like domain-containing protein [Candidatus Thermoplasmatota archaeon]
EDQGLYQITLSAWDVLNNTGTDTFYVNVSLLKGPEVISTDPIDQAVDVPVDKVISVTFDLRMSEDPVESNFSISPGMETSLTWNLEASMLSISFFSPLEYNTLYTIEISGGEALDGRQRTLQPIILRFRTKERHIGPAILIRSPTGDGDYEIGQILEISGIANGISQGEVINIELGSEAFEAEVDEYGFWTVTVELPSTIGVYRVTAVYGELSVETKFEVHDPPEEKQNSMLAPLMIIGIAVVIIIVLVIVILLFTVKGDGYDEE